MGQYDINNEEWTLNSNLKDMEYYIIIILFHVYDILEKENIGTENRSLVSWAVGEKQWSTIKGHRKFCHSKLLVKEVFSFLTVMMVTCLCAFVKTHRTIY